MRGGKEKGRGREGGRGGEGREGKWNKCAPRMDALKI